MAKKKRFKTDGGFRSGFEGKVEEALKRKYKKNYSGYEIDTFAYPVIRHYTVDFSVAEKIKGTKLSKPVYIEAKGRFTSADRTKMLTIKKEYPNIDIRLIFQQDNWLTKKKKKRYSDWAEQHGFKYSIWPELP